MDRKTPRTGRTPLGFTLTEVMIVVAVIGIIASAAIPSVIAMREKRTTLTVARTLTEHLRGIRHLATNTNRAYLVTIEQGDGQTGDAKGKLTVTPSDSGACVPGSHGISNKLSINLGNPGDIVGRRYVNRNVQVVYMAPEPTTSICFKPDGSIVGLATGSHVVPGSQSAGDCSGEGYPTDPTDPKHWKARCGRPGTICLKVAYLNDECPDRCQRFSDGCSAHLGVDRIISMNFSGETRIIQ